MEAMALLGPRHGLHWHDSVRSGATPAAALTAWTVRLYYVITDQPVLSLPVTGL